LRLAATFSAHADELVINSRRWPLPCPIILDSHGRVTIYEDGLAFTFGAVDQRFGDLFQFVPAAGDQVTFIRTAGRIPWPTPLYGLFTLGASRPKWSRHVYDTLRWTKPSGALLEMTWRDQQRLQPNGWSDEYNNRIASFRIRQGPLETGAAAYLARTKKWDRHDFRLEAQLPQANLQEVAGIYLAAIYLKDASAQQPGAGHSVLLKMDRLKNQVIGETGWQ
jgi:hypothetical protein